ncbi:hypothetical protein BJ508DRAFT_312683 [Ascobolus immersus RN42]|uniref:Uncharacterized protein n=1 Tax=Ascobolus immersus RN42 TaxID=1160509 RepID=A0A3N4HLD6_ASCIM|nr:hypothetical protein BJ508DRAFT_312683 [Ascobolus immersus RN42]
MSESQRVSELRASEKPELRRKEGASGKPEVGSEEGERGVGIEPEGEQAVRRITCQIVGQEAGIEGSERGAGNKKSVKKPEPKGASEELVTKSQPESRNKSERAGSHIELKMASEKPESSLKENEKSYLSNNQSRSRNRGGDE